MTLPPVATAWGVPWWHSGFSTDMERHGKPWIRKQIRARCGGKMKHIGILAHSAEGAALCFRTACQEGIRQLGAHNHPEITLTCSPMHESMSDWAAGNLNPIRERFVAEAEKLQAAGADFFVLPDNTAHLALEAEGRDFPIAALHIA